MLPHLLLVAVLLLSVYSQLMMKSRALVHSSGTDASADYLQYLVGMATDWRVLSAAGAAFLLASAGCSQSSASISGMHFHLWHCPMC
jgi:hypothetical protein